VCSSDLVCRKWLAFVQKAKQHGHASMAMLPMGHFANAV
jgi:hypothetical protein